MYKFVLLFLPLAYADSSLDMDAITSKQLLNAPQYNRESTLNNETKYKVESAPNQSNGDKLNKDSSLLNQDGSIGVNDDTKMQVSPNGVRFKFSY